MKKQTNKAMQILIFYIYLAKTMFDLILYIKFNYLLNLSCVKLQTM